MVGGTHSLRSLIKSLGTILCDVGHPNRKEKASSWSGAKGGHRCRFICVRYTTACCIVLVVDWYLICHLFSTLSIVARIHLCRRNSSSPEGG